MSCVLALIAWGLLIAASLVRALGSGGGPRGLLQA